MFGFKAEISEPLPTRLRYCSTIESISQSRFMVDIFSIIFKVVKLFSIMQRSQSVHYGIRMIVVVECWLSVGLR